MATSNETGEIIRFHRKRSGLTQLELAERAGVGKTVVFDIENGKETVQVDTLRKVFAALNIRVKLESSFMNEFSRSRIESDKKT